MADVAGNVTWIILTRPDDEQHERQATPSGRVIGLVEDEQLSPEVVAAREKLAKLRVAEEAARQKNKALDQSRNSDH